MFTNLNVAWPMRDLTAQAKIASGQGAGPASYETGGEAVTLADLGLSEVWWFSPIVAYNGTVVLIARYDPTTNKLIWFDLTGAEVSALEDLSLYTYEFFATGK
jgi:hypothetical protein